MPDVTTRPPFDSELGTLAALEARGPFTLTNAILPKIGKSTSPSRP